MRIEHWNPFQSPDYQLWHFHFVLPMSSDPLLIRNLERLILYFPAVSSWTTTVYCLIGLTVSVFYRIVCNITLVCLKLIKC